MARRNDRSSESPRKTSAASDFNLRPRDRRISYTETSSSDDDVEMEESEEEPASAVAEPKVEKGKAGEKSRQSSSDLSSVGSVCPPKRPEGKPPRKAPPTTRRPTRPTRQTRQTAKSPSYEPSPVPESEQSPAPARHTRRVKIVESSSSSEPSPIRPRKQRPGTKKRVIDSSDSSPTTPAPGTKRKRGSSPSPTPAAKKPRVKAAIKSAWPRPRVSSSDNDDDESQEAEVTPAGSGKGKRKASSPPPGPPPRSKAAKKSAFPKPGEVPEWEKPSSSDEESEPEFEAPGVVHNPALVEAIVAARDTATRYARELAGRDADMHGIPTRLRVIRDQLAGMIVQLPGRLGTTATPPSAERWIQELVDALRDLSGLEILSDLDQEELSDEIATVVHHLNVVMNLPRPYEQYH